MLQGKSLVQVGQWDIDNSKRWQPECCPIACASLRELFKWVSVGPTSVSGSDIPHPTDDRTFKEYKASEAFYDWISTYDHTGKAQPITLEFDHDNCTVEIVS